VLGASALGGSTASSTRNHPGPCAAPCGVVILHTASPPLPSPLKWSHGSQLLYARTTARSPRKLNHGLTRSDIRLMQYFDSSAHGLVRRWLLIGYSLIHLLPPPPPPVSAPHGEAPTRVSCNRNNLHSDFLSGERLSFFLMRKAEMRSMRR
jgi:hypothetical protein